MILKRIYYIIAVLTGMLFAFQAKASSGLVELGDSAYTTDNFQQAVSAYEAAISKDGVSPGLYYNLGNAYYRNNQTGKAIVAYERALKLDPSYKDARFNLKFINSNLPDKQIADNSLWHNLWSDIISLMTANAWAWTAFALSVLCVILASLYIYTTGITLRKTGFFGGIATLILTVFAVTVAISAADKATGHDEGVVISGSTIISAAPRQPRDRKEEIALIHEGTKLNILDSLTTRNDSTSLKWYKVSLDDTHQGWVPASILEII